MNVKELKINDRVGFYRRHYGTFLTKGFGKVTKINGHGHITVMPKQETGVVLTPLVFDKYGNERKRPSPCSLCFAEWLEETLAKQEADNAKQQAIRNLVQYIEAQRYGGGHYGIGEQEKEEIKKLLDLI